MSLSGSCGPHGPRTRAHDRTDRTDRTDGRIGRIGRIGQIGRTDRIGRIGRSGRARAHAISRSRSHDLLLYMNLDTVIGARMHIYKFCVRLDVMSFVCLCVIVQLRTLDMFCVFRCGRFIRFFSIFAKPVWALLYGGTLYSQHASWKSGCRFDP